MSQSGGNSNPGRHTALPITAETIGSVKSVGFPYVFNADITVREYGCNILSGDDGRFFTDNSGKLHLERESYTFDFGYVIPKDKQVNITLYGDNRHTLLIVDDTWFYEAENSRNRTNTKSTTFVIPLEKIGDDNCTVENLIVKTPDFDPKNMLCNVNLAAGKTATVSGLEVDYLSEPLAFDGDEGTRLSFARNKDEQWLLVDLGSVELLNKVVINFFERVSAYELYTSEDGENFTKVYSVSNLEEGVKASDVIEFEPIEARYIKYVQLKRWYCAPYNTYYSGGICEFEAYSSENDYSQLIVKAEGIDDKEVKTAFNNLVIYSRKAQRYRPHLEGLCALLEEAITIYENKPQEQSDVSNELSVDESKSSELSADEKPIEKDNENLLPWIIASVIALIVICVVAVVIIKLKK